MSSGGGAFRKGGVAKFQVAWLVYVMKSLPTNLWFTLLDLHLHITSITVRINLLLLSYNFRLVVLFLFHDQKAFDQKVRTL